MCELEKLKKHYITIEEKKLAWCFVLKCARTSIGKQLDACEYTTNYNTWYDKFQHPNYYRFIFVRNPWDRLVSTFRYMQENGGFKRHIITVYANSKCPVEPFERFVETVCGCPDKESDMHIRSQYISLPQLSPPAHFIGKFERLEEDWQRLVDKFDLPPLERHDRSTTHNHYSEYYSPALVDLVAKRYQEDIERFNYKFEKPT
jgi:hypothetical protein